MSTPREEQHRRIFWRSRRGMLELDALLLPFVEHVFPHLTREKQDIYIRLLESEDTQLFDWLVHGRQPDDKQLQQMVHEIRHGNGQRS